jgi:hypothetical protein
MPENVWWCLGFCVWMVVCVVGCVVLGKWVDRA